MHRSLLICFWNISAIFLEWCKRSHDDYIRKQDTALYCPSFYINALWKDYSVQFSGFVDAPIADVEDDHSSGDPYEEDTFNLPIPSKDLYSNHQIFKSK